MKQVHYRALLLAACLLTAGTVWAQEQETATAAPLSTPRWASEKGYWIVESNIHTPRQYTIRFYNNDQVLVYKEKVQGQTLKLSRKKVKMNLKKVLETAILAWEKQPQLKENEGWVSNGLFN